MNNVFFEIKDGCTYFKVKVTTKASKNAVTGIKNGELLVCVTTVPENGKANEAIVKLLSKAFKCAKTKLNLISGEKSRNKLFRVDEVLDFSKFVQDMNSKEINKKTKK
ncbi:MAG: DUF167 domain-containing protein [Alphaproteobacteria bacterium]|nr:DUF167 domain-containing protein [Alphaproteobacteria bacterium]